MEEVSPDGEQSWYFVRATYKAVHLGRVRRRHLWERTVFLIRALGNDGLVPHEMAVLRANEVAREKEHEYEVEGGDTVRWVFQQIEDIQPLVDEPFGDGTEVYWEFFERVDRKEQTPASSM
jgi:hypothetical protein